MLTFMITLIFCSRFSTILLFYYMLAPISHSEFCAILLSCCFSTLVFHLRSLAVVSSCYIPVLTIFVVFSLLCYTLIFCCKISAILLLLLMLNSPLFLESLSLKTFKQFLSNKL